MSTRITREGSAVLDSWADVKDSDYPNWSVLVRKGLLQERILPHPAPIEGKKYDKQYIDPAKFVRETISKSTIFWYPNGNLMGLFLRGVIPEPIQKHALIGLEAIKFPDKPFTKRKECQDARKFNKKIKRKAPVDAAELTIGFMDWGSVRMTTPTKVWWKELAFVDPLFEVMNDIYARTLPKPWGEQNRPLSGQHTKEGGIHTEFRRGLTAFSTISIPKSCPTSVHVDRGNGQGYSCLTSLRGKDFVGGGEFCILNYGLRIPVKPGDLFIGATMKEWHCNLTPVDGTKYSVVCYYRRGLGSIKRRKGWAKLGNKNASRLRRKSE